MKFSEFMAEAQIMQEEVAEEKKMQEQTQQQLEQKRFRNGRK